MSKKEFEVGKSGSGSRVSGLSDRIKNIPISKRKWWVFAIIIAIGILPVLIPFVTNLGSFFGINKPAADTDQTTGYATIEFLTTAPNDAGFERLDVDIALVNYDTDIVDNPEFNVAGISDTMLIEETTLAYVWRVNNGSVAYDNFTFVIFASDSESTPYRNVVYIDRKTLPGDLEVNIYDVGGVRGDYDVSDLTSESEFVLALNNTSNIKMIGNTYYIPETYQVIDNIYAALWLETDAVIVNWTVVFIGSESNTPANMTINTNAGKSYIQMPVLQEMQYVEIQCSVIFTSLPTYFKFYDGVPLASDLVLTKV